MIHSASIHFFVTDLHGKTDRYQKLFQKILQERPSSVFLGGDLLPHRLTAFSDDDPANFFQGTLVAGFDALKKKLADRYPRVFVIPGNDDARCGEQAFIRAGSEGIWEYLHNKKTTFGKYTVYGYACVPPTPFLLKDWELYDTARYVDPGCVAPEDGFHTVAFKKDDILYKTIAKDIELLTGDDDLSESIFLFHSPPYRTKLDRTALDGKMIDHVPLDVHTGSIAIKRMIKKRQPLLTLHGHIHESTRLTGSWSDRIRRTFCFNAAHDGPELALIRFDPGNLHQATRELI